MRCLTSANVPRLYLICTVALAARCCIHFRMEMGGSAKLRDWPKVTRLSLMEDSTYPPSLIRKGELLTASGCPPNSPKCGTSLVMVWNHRSHNTMPPQAFRMELNSYPASYCLSGEGTVELYTPGGTEDALIRLRDCDFLKVMIVTKCEVEMRSGSASFPSV